MYFCFYALIYSKFSTLAHIDLSTYYHTNLHNYDYDKWVKDYINKSEAVYVLQGIIYNIVYSNYLCSRL